MNYHKQPKDCYNVYLQVLLKSSLSLAMTIYTVAALAAAVACMVLPIETNGKELTESVPPRVTNKTRVIQ